MLTKTVFCVMSDGGCDLAPYLNQLCLVIVFPVVEYTSGQDAVEFAKTLHCVVVRSLHEQTEKSIQSAMVHDQRRIWLLKDL